MNDGLMMQLARRAEVSLDAAVTMLLLSDPAGEAWLDYEPALRQLTDIIRAIAAHPRGVTSNGMVPSNSPEFLGWLYENLDALASDRHQDPRILAAAALNQQRFAILRAYPQWRLPRLH